MPEIRNPNLQSPGNGPGGSGGDMRTMLAFTLLALLVLLGFQYFSRSRLNSRRFRRSRHCSSPRRVRRRRARASTATAQTAAQGPAIAAAAENDTTVENEWYRITFSNRGGQVKHWILKKYNDTAGKPLDMVQPQAAARFGFPLSFFTYDQALTKQLNQALYQAAPSAECRPAVCCWRPPRSPTTTRKTAWMR